MTFDTEWPASSPRADERPSRIEADRLAWCIRYLAEEARRGGFLETAEALESIGPTKTADQHSSHAANNP